MRVHTIATLAAAIAFAIPAAAATRISDPVAFVKEVYRTKVGRTVEPDDIYTDRLNALWKLDTKDAHGEVGRVDFDFWMNGQDGDVTDVRVSKLAVENANDRMIVISRFKNEKTPNEIHFFFEKTAKGWKLDDVRSLMGDPWVLSLQLKYGWDGKQ